jgi:asparagine synthase (glutamine-hydrolysing)
MFAFALWDERKKLLFCARDRFGMKPFYYAIIKGVFYFASEAKAILPFLSEIKTNKEALAEYLTFQYTIGEKTLFENIKQLMPANLLILKKEKLDIKEYWDVEYKIDHTMNFDEAATKVTELLKASVKLHGQSDVPVASYISGGIDSSLIFSLAQDNSSAAPFGFHGRFSEYPGYDESSFAKSVVKHDSEKLHIAEIGAEDFRKYFEKVIYHLDFPVAGPGSFAQYMVSKLAAKHVKVVLGGQGGDEIFGGYARYVIAYLEQSLKAAIDGTYKKGSFVVTIESIIPNLGLLREYKPLLKKFWSKNLFNPMDERYFSLVERTTEMGNVIEWKSLNMSKVKSDFSLIFNNTNNVDKDAYF